MKLWQKNSAPDKQVDLFTTGNDRELDLLMAKHDVIGSIAHAQMLSSCGLISAGEFHLLKKELKIILALIENGSFSIEDGIEDVHSQVEFMLTKKLGDTGKKIHTARSRNDQSLLDIKLFIREEIQKLTGKTEELFPLLLSLAEQHSGVLLPGYTHFQVAMPSSFGLWFSAYAESLCDDLELMLAAYRMADKNPLGSAAGYGSSFPIDREMTTTLLGFSGMNVSSVYAQMTRGKTEKACATAIAALAFTLSKLAADCTLYMSQNFGFISFPEHLTTGSSIMPHKKNPDVWELIRGKCNRLQSLPNELALLLANLPSGYHRDLQLTKEILFPAFHEISSCMDMTILMLENIRVHAPENEDDKYKYLFTVESVNELVKKGVSFRDAYVQTGMAVENGTYVRPASSVHTHTGSAGNLRTDLISAAFGEMKKRFSFGKAENAISALLC
ncbi:MAG TPA: argininosuccinate lyase [Bacteroidia bacterium]|nr:argininosuccinate lyase [Bacteroidia bacterium]